MDYFFTVTFDDEPVTIAIDTRIRCAYIIIGANTDSLSLTLSIHQAFVFKGSVELFDVDEVWALIAAVREEANDVIRYAAELLEAQS